MTTLTMDCWSELAVALGKRESDVANEIRLASALKLFEMGRISSGLAAKLAGMDRISFLLICGQYGVSILQQNDVDISDDIDAIKNIL